MLIRSVALVMAGWAPAQLAAQITPAQVIAVPCCRCLDGQTRDVMLNTGSGLAAVKWTVTGPGSASGSVAQTVAASTQAAVWTGNLAPAQWVHPNSTNGNDNYNYGTYNYTIRLVVPHCTVPAKIVLNGEAAADDELKGFLNSTKFVETPAVAVAWLPLSAGSTGWGFLTERIASFSNIAVGPGTHILRFEVSNIAQTRHGLIVRAALTFTCPPETAPRTWPVDTGHSNAVGRKLPEVRIPDPDPLTNLPR